MKKVIFFAIIVIFLFIINNFFHSIYSLWQKQDLIISARKELAREKQEQQKLKQNLETVNKPAYLEEEARNKLFLVKPGEEVVVLPSIPQSQIAKPATVKKPIPIWQQWFTLF